ncbi:hypothetical protein ACFLT7_04145 [candidate division KSB1 bacterium]
MDRLLGNNSNKQLEEVISPVLNRLLKPIHDLQIDPKLTYCQNHLWLQQVDESVWRLGIDSFVASIFCQITEIILPTFGSSKPGDTQCFWLVHVDGMVMISLPMDAKNLVANESVRKSPNLVLADPCGEGWLLQGELDMGNNSRYIIPPDKVDDWWRYEIDWLEGLIRSNLVRRMEHHVGETLADGGYFINDISTALGPTAHRDLLQQVLKL